MGMPFEGELPQRVRTQVAHDMYVRGLGGPEIFLLLLCIPRGMQLF